MLPNEPYIVLIPAWGASYVEQALRFSVPSMFAPGNIPALAKKHDVRIVFLTDTQSIPTIAAHPFAKVIEKYCVLDYIDISTVMYTENYGVTLTLAYACGIKKVQEEFESAITIFSNSDIIFSNNSFGYIERSLDGPFDGIATTGVRGVEEFSQQSIEEQIGADGVLSVDSDFLADLALRNPHPTDLASTLSNDEYFHEAANHFFIGDWKKAVVGFWFLRAMLAIRVKKNLEAVYSFCDYVFLPYFVDEERIARPVDCHDLFMFELSPKNQESHYIKPGSISLASQMDSVRKFANAHHRINGRTPYFLYRKKDVALLSFLKKQFDAEIPKIDDILGDRVKPFRGHPYWNSAIASLIFHEKTFPDWVEYDRNIADALQLTFGGKTIIDDPHPLGPGKRLARRIPLVRRFGIDSITRWLVSYAKICDSVHMVSSFDNFVQYIMRGEKAHNEDLFVQHFGEFYQKVVILEEPIKNRGVFIFFGLLEDWKVVVDELTERGYFLDTEAHKTCLSTDIVLGIASKTITQYPVNTPPEELLKFAFSGHGTKRPSQPVGA